MAQTIAASQCPYALKNSSEKVVRNLVKQYQGQVRQQEQKECIATAYILLLSSVFVKWMTKNASVHVFAQLTLPFPIPHSGRRGEFGGQHGGAGHARAAGEGARLEGVPGEAAVQAGLRLQHADAERDGHPVLGAARPRHGRHLGPIHQGA